MNDHRPFVMRLVLLSLATIVVACEYENTPVSGAQLCAPATAKQRCPDGYVCSERTNRCFVIGTSDVDADATIPDGGSGDSPDVGSSTDLGGGDDTAPPSDASPLTVTLGALTDAPLDVWVLTFSAPMNKESVSAKVFPAFEFTLEWEADDTVARMVATTPIPANGLFRLTVAGMDPGSRMVETTFEVRTMSGADTSAPRLLGHTPAHQARDVDGEVVELRFSEGLDPSSLASGVSVSDGITCTWAIDPTASIATCTPDLPWASEKTYSVSVTAGVKDKAGNALSNPTDFSFTMGSFPRLVEHSPKAGATGVSVTAPITLTFSRAMKASAVESSFSLDKGYTCTWSWNSTQTVATCTVKPQVLEDNEVTATLTTGATDLVGVPMRRPTTFKFLTGPVPKVTAFEPAHDAKGIPTTQTIKVTFSEPMNPATVALSLVPAAPCPLVWNGTQTSFSCALQAAMDTAYTATVKSTASDKAGNPLPSDLVFSFLTGPAPTLTSFAPEANAVFVPLAAEVRLTFSEPMDQTSVQGAFAFSPNVGTPAFVWNAEGTAVTVTPGGAHAPGQVVTWSLGTGAKDLGGNPLVAASSSFTVRKLYTKKLYSDVSKDGYLGTGCTTAAVYVYSAMNQQSLNSGTGFCMSGGNTWTVFYKTHFSFSLAELLNLGASFELKSATLNLRIGNVQTITGAAPTHIDSVFYDVLDANDWGLMQLDRVSQTLPMTPSTSVSVPITAFVKSDLANATARKGLTQVRVQTPNHMTFMGPFAGAANGAPYVEVEYYAP